MDTDPEISSSNIKMDTEKKRKMDCVETRDLREVLEKFMASSTDIAQLISVLFEKIVQIENILKKYV